MEFSAGDYVIVGVRDDDGNKTKRNVLLQVTSAEKGSKGIIEGVLEKDCHIPSKRTTAQFAKKEVIINLGPTPSPGKVYGVDVSSLFKGRKRHDTFGPLNFFYKPEKEVMAKIMKTFDRAAKQLAAVGVEGCIDPSSQQWEIHPHNGEKYAGMYRKSKDNSKYPDTFLLRPEASALTDLPYYIHHEFAHLLHLNHSIANTKLDADWLRLYNTSIKPKVVKGSECQQFLKGLLSQNDPPSQYGSNLDDEDKKRYRLVLKAIQKEHSLSPKELDILWEVDYRDDFEYFWPKRVTEKDVAPLVSEYGTKHYKELIADSISFYIIGKKLPKEVTKLVERTLSYIAKA